MIDKSKHELPNKEFDNTAVLALSDELQKRLREFANSHVDRGGSHTIGMMMALKASIISTSGVFGGLASVQNKLPADEAMKIAKQWAQNAIYETSKVIGVE